jgi:hypothetical protein
MRLSRERPTRERAGWDAALLEIEHQAEHWNTPDHGETGSLIAQALLAAVEIARAGGLQCEHRQLPTAQPQAHARDSYDRSPSVRL